MRGLGFWFPEPGLGERRVRVHNLRCFGRCRQHARVRGWVFGLLHHFGGCGDTRTDQVSGLGRGFRKCILWGGGCLGLSCFIPVGIVGQAPWIGPLISAPLENRSQSCQQRPLQSSMCGAGSEYVRAILGLYGNNGKENGNYHNGL